MLHASYMEFYAILARINTRFGLSLERGSDRSLSLIWPWGQYPGSIGMLAQAKSPVLVVSDQRLRAALASDMKFVLAMQVEPFQK